MGSGWGPMPPTDPLDCEVVITRSGAPAVRDRVTGELMHPLVGPRVEAERLYVAPSRLRERWSGDVALVLLDVGLGAGSNALAAWEASEAPREGRRLEIRSLDRSLGALRLAASAAHAEAFGYVGAAAEAAAGLLRDGRHEGRRTTWTYTDGDLLRTLAEVPADSVDIVFWDPFSPNANPACWGVAAFTALRRVSRAGATVHTYSGATAVRSAMVLGGFAVGVGVEVGAQKRSTVGAVDVADLAEPLDGRWLERLARSSAGFPPDAPADALARVRGMPQFAG